MYRRMAPKRKLAVAEPETTPGSPGSSSGSSNEDGLEQQQATQDLRETHSSKDQPRHAAGPKALPLSSVENYPRKRISIACNLCRFRKTKCDAVRPTCGFCAGLGVECQYRETTNTTATPKESRRRHSTARLPVAPPEPSNAAALAGTTSVADIERRLLDLESKWARLEKHKFEAVVSPELSLSAGLPAASEAQSAPGSNIGPAPSGGMPLPAMLGGLSPPVSNAGHGNNSNGHGVATRSKNTVDAGTGSMPHDQRHGSVSSSTETVPGTSSLSGRGSHSGGHAVGFMRRKTPPGQHTARPSLLTFDSPAYVQSESWDDSGEFYDAEMAAGDEFNRHMTQSLAIFPDVSKRTVRLVLQSFVENFLGWMPIFEPTAVYTIVNAACANGFAPSDPNSCLAMLILATGTLLQNHADVRSNPLPGLDYFAHGSRYLERFTFMSSSLTALHCRILQAAYFKLTLHPLLSWNTVMQGTRDCMNVLSSRWWKSLDLSAREPWHRAFWACSVITDEHEASIRLHTIGHRIYHDIVPLPRFENEDTGFYYFLAQISLRKLVTATLDVVGYHEAKVIYAPVVTTELRNQAREWHRHLPVAIRFPLDNTPLFDARKSFLRMQYFSLNTVLEWASVLRVMEAYGTEQETSDEIVQARLEALECFRFCTLYMDVAAEQLLVWKLGTCISIWTAFVFLATLIITYKKPALAFIPATRDDTHVRNALELLRPWNHVPFVACGIARMSGMMERIGITP